MNIVNELERALSLRIEVSQLLSAPSLDAFLRVVGQAAGGAAAGEPSLGQIRPVPPRDHYAVSSAQRRIYALCRLEESDVRYNIPVAMTLEGAVDRARLERALATVVARHEALRTSFELRDGEVVAIVHPSVTCELDYVEANVEEGARLERDFIRPFDLERAPLLR